MGDRREPLARLEALVRDYARLVRSVAARVGGSDGRQIADDVEQVVFLNLWRQLEREQTIDAPASYIYRCAVRETIRLLRTDGRTRDAGAVPDGTDDQPDTAGDPETLAARRELVRRIDDTVSRLPADRRRAVRAHLSGFTVSEIMEMHGWPYQKARNLIARGMADIRSALRARGIDG